ncbi:MAG: SUF system NifU family Fe-S cluster assembly protein [Actinomycetota bacterium]|nr:SUF system NifU family Fe-S cluster assembly protein [Actinomycetota bacterium]
MQGLEDLYREIILDHYKNPRNSGQLDSPPAHRAEGYNPLCGDEVAVYVANDGDRIVDIKMSGQGCSISRSSASLMTVAVKGKSVAEAREAIRTFKNMMSIHEAALGAEAEDQVGPADLRTLGELAALQGVVKFPVRIKCATLAWNTLSQLLDEIEAGESN